MKTHELLENTVACPVCGKECKPLGLASHITRIHHPETVKWKKPNKTGWSAGHTKDTHAGLKKISSALAGKPTWTKGTKASDAHRSSISASMKIAHAENRAHNIGSSRWNNQPSYPEKFFAEVIENEFDDKNFKREFPVGRYSIDFAWPHLKKAIEIDGDQHERFEKQRESDARKDKALEDAGWKVLRVKWKTMYADTRAEIARCKAFIDTMGR